ncbi:hypothetical protein HY486_00690 [Candidatus Woesearchaeota archaeon]|nr:hypothetical protein [Candidatus Woesearchaeota archaeon]
MKLVFDAGPIISLTTNNLLWILRDLKKLFDGDFCITKGVRYELVEKPLLTKKFKFEAFQVEKLIEERVLNVETPDVLFSQNLANIANSCFFAQGHPLKIVQNGEMETLAFALRTNKIAVVDERITPMLVEDPERLVKILENRFHFRIFADKKVLQQLRGLLSSLKIIRSVELVAVAFEKGILDGYIVGLPHAKEELLDSLLWGVKLQGCSVSEEEIKNIESRVLSQHK